MIRSLVAVTLIGAGLWCALLSNPHRFPDNVAFDRQIDLLAGSGFVCTVAGLWLLLATLGRSTTPMPQGFRNRTNLGVGLGTLLQLLGMGILLTRFGDAAVLSGLVLIAGSLPIFVWGCMNYAEGKNHSKWFGLLGAAGVFGLVLLIALPVRDRAAANHPD